MTEQSERLAIYLPNLNGGGAQRVTINLAGGMADRGYQVDLVLASASGSYMTEIPQGVRVVNLNASRALKSLPRLIRYLRRERPHAMLSVMNYANITALWARRIARVPIRLVVGEHDVLSHASRNHSSIRGRLMPYFVRLFYPWADGIVAVF